MSKVPPADPFSSFPLAVQRTCILNIHTDTQLLPRLDTGIYIVRKDNKNKKKSFCFVFHTLLCLFYNFGRKFIEPEEIRLYNNIMANGHTTG